MIRLSGWDALLQTGKALDEARQHISHARHLVCRAWTSLPDKIRCPTCSHTVQALTVIDSPRMGDPVMCDGCGRAGAIMRHPTRMVVGWYRLWYRRTDHGIKKVDMEHAFPNDQS